jgi:hypothetical protein
MCSPTAGWTATPEPIKAGPQNESGRTLSGRFTGSKILPNPKSLAKPHTRPRIATWFYLDFFFIFFFFVAMMITLMFV